jgi:glycosyltransferase involved in cell wall biosynthesis
MGHSVTVVCSSFDGAQARETVEGISIIRLRNDWALPLRIFNEYTRRLRGKIDVVVEEAIGGQRLPFLTTLYVKEPLVAVWHQKNTKVFHEQYFLPIAIAFSLLEIMQAGLYKKRLIVTPSKGAKEGVLALGFSAENVKVVYDGLGRAFLNSKPYATKEEIIVWLGKLRRYKRPDHAIMAHATILKEIKKPMTLVIAGKISEIDLRYANELASLAKRLCVGDRVQFKFNLSEIEKIDLLKKARALVQPSPVEGFSIVVIEANSCGVPVVASSGVPKDVVVDGYNGLTYPYGDIQLLSRALIKLLNDESLWKKLSERSVEWAQNFTWEKSANELNTLLENVVPAKTVGCRS